MCRSRPMFAASFNGAPGFYRGRATVKRLKESGDLELQWGPRVLPGESAHRRHRAGRRHAAASMGPPGFTGGERCTAQRYAWRPPCFNGAPGFYRGRGARRADVARRATASMGPPGFTGGECRLAQSQSHADCRASMGPPGFTGGEKPQTASRPSCWHGFNGAPGFYRGRVETWRSGSLGGLTLQWGPRVLPGESVPPVSVIALSRR